MLRYLPLLLVLAVWIYAFIDCLNTPEQEVRKLPKVVWVIIILLFGQVLLGPIAWFVAGRPRKNAPYGATRPDERRWVAPDDNPEFLKSLENGPRAAADERTADEPPADDRPANDLPVNDRPAAGPDGGRRDPVADEKLFQEWEADLRRREDEIRGKDNGSGPAPGSDDTPPKG